MPTATCTPVSHRQSGYTEHNYAKHRESIFLCCCFWTKGNGRKQTHAGDSGFQRVKRTHMAAAAAAAASDRSPERVHFDLLVESS